MFQEEHDVLLTITVTSSTRNMIICIINEIKARCKHNRYIFQEEHDVNVGLQLYMQGD